MIISLLLLLPVYLPLAWIDWHVFRQRYGRGDLLRQLLVLGSTALTVVVMHVQMQAMQGIWTAVLPALTAYGVMLVVWAVLLFWRNSRS